MKKLPLYSSSTIVRTLSDGTRHKRRRVQTVHKKRCNKVPVLSVFTIIAFLIVSLPSHAEKKFSWEHYATVSFYGAVGGAAALPFEHPLDCLKTNMQALPNNHSALAMTKQIYRTNGLAGFYRGYVPNTLRVVLKQIYRWPMMLFIPLGLDSLNLFKRSEMNKMVTALVIAHFECFIITPLERIKVWLMTSFKGKGGVLYFFTKNKRTLGSQLLAGLRPVYAKQMVSWVTFLVADDYFRTKAHKYFKTDSPLDFWILLIISIIIGIINTLCIMPFDCVKTHHQKNTTTGKRKLFKTMHEIYKTHGLSGLYNGWKVRLLQYIVHASFTVTILERLEIALR